MTPTYSWAVVVLMTLFTTCAVASAQAQGSEFLDRNRKGYAAVVRTFLELRGSLRFNEGDEVLMGEHRFRLVEMQTPTAKQPAAAPQREVQAPAGEPVIVLPDGKKVAAGNDRPMLSFLAEAGAATDASGSIGCKWQILWECWDQNEPNDTVGSCGLCVVTILEGMALLNEAGSKERNTIKKSNKELGGKFDDSKCRLACHVIVPAPVKIQPSRKTDG